MGDISLVSIVLLTYNHERYIGDCLQSILEQDYGKIELLMLDDASKDKTVAIIESYFEALREKCDYVLFIKNKKNKGNIPFNMNRLLKKSRGSYCKMLGGDDILEHNCISRLVQGLLDHPECSVVYSNVYTVPDDYRKGGWVEKPVRYYFYRKSEVEPDDFFRKLMYGNPIAAPSAMIKRTILDEYGFLDETIPYEDYEYWLRLSVHNVKFCFLNESLVYYRKSLTSISNYEDGRKIKKIKTGMLSDIKTLNKYLQYWNKEDREKCKKHYYYRYLRICWEKKYLRGTAAIIYKLKKEKMKLPLDLFAAPSKDQWERNVYRKQITINMLEKWILNVQAGKPIVNYFRENNFKKIGIYGLGCIANLLCEELKNTGIKVEYVLDRNADKLLYDVKMATECEGLEETDVIVVIPAGEYCEIKEHLEKQISCPIVYVGDILFS